MGNGSGIRYAVRKKGTEDYLQPSSDFGPLSSAYMWSEELWQEESESGNMPLYKDEERVQIEFTVVAIVEQG